MRQINGRPLWLGNASDLRNTPLLFAAGIVAVVDLAGNEPPAALPREFVYCRFPIVDGGGNPVWLLRGDEPQSRGSVGGARESGGIVAR